MFDKLKNLDNLISNSDGKYTGIDNADQKLDNFEEISSKQENITFPIVTLPEIPSQINIPINTIKEPPKLLTDNSSDILQRERIANNVDKLIATLLDTFLNQEVLLENHKLIWDSLIPAINKKRFTFKSIGIYFSTHEENITQVFTTIGRYKNNTSSLINENLTLNLAALTAKELNLLPRKLPDDFKVDSLREVFQKSVPFIGVSAIGILPFIVDYVSKSINFNKVEFPVYEIGIIASSLLVLGYRNIFSKRLVKAQESLSTLSSNLRNIKVSNDTPLFVDKILEYNLLKREDNFLTKTDNFLTSIGFGSLALGIGLLLSNISPKILEITALTFQTDLGKTNLGTAFAFFLKNLLPLTPLFIFRNQIKKVKNCVLVSDASFNKGYKILASGINLLCNSALPCIYGYLGYLTNNFLFSNLPTIIEKVNRVGLGLTIFSRGGEISTASGSLVDKVSNEYAGLFYIATFGIISLYGTVKNIRSK